MEDFFVEGLAWMVFFCGGFFDQILEKVAKNEGRFRLD